MADIVNPVILDNNRHRPISTGNGETITGVSSDLPAGPGIITEISNEHKYYRLDPEYVKSRFNMVMCGNGVFRCGV